MKKSFLKTTACVLALALLLGGCGGLKTAESSIHEVPAHDSEQTGEETAAEVGEINGHALVENTDEVNTLAGVTMTVDECSADGAAYMIQNGSDAEISFGLDFGVQAEKNGVWYSIQHEGMAVISILKLLEAGTEGTYTCGWTDGYGSLPAGHYRLVKAVTAGWKNESYWLAAEFTLE